jgi:hypothetical protein
MLLGFFLMLLGIISAIPFVLGLIGGPPGLGTAAVAMAGILWVGAFVGAGFLLMHKGRLGLWIIYFLSAVFVYWFCTSTFHLLSTRSRNDIYLVIWNGFCLMIWLSIAQYFHNRRRQFTRWLGSTGNSQSEQR